MIPLPDKKYSIIYADPPWSYQNRGTRAAASKHYDTMTNENSVSTNDNGVTQTVEARQGVALNALIEIKPRVMLRPFRTFLEVEQPESEFLLRVDPDEGIGFFEADGGIWKLEAKKNIADYFLKNMGDLIDAGKVVVMQ